MKTLKLCREFYETLIGSILRAGVKLTVTPDGTFIDNRSSFICVGDLTGSEIICSKSTYLRLFCEARLYLTNKTLEEINNDDDSYYIATVGLLSTTPEDRHNLNLHEQLLLRHLKQIPETKWRLHEEESRFLQRELHVVKLLLTSNLKRVNKSSSLWLLFRKLYTLSRELNPAMKLDYCDLFVRSAANHFSNYYCWNTFRWMYDVENAENRSLMSESVWNFCFRNPKDSSAWWALGHTLSSDHRVEKHSIGHFNQLRVRFGFEPHVIDASLGPHSVKYIYHAQKVLKFIELAEVREWPPFLCLAKLLQYMSHRDQRQFLKSWRSDIELFESKHFKLDDKSVNMAMYEIGDDLLLRRTFESLLPRKKLIEYRGRVDARERH
ncbi:LANO_0D05534g1_1 [Lachancea nothofagi CBS 11611]|uniref:LANO_0D05534g1_1 n=1 Tax=Lachancea nothofagi CBS 11611 TaxID=1266666 RepID=A0A1G4JGU2_9SACH|nr:LANO_0D05534g1_1 [Lachancea nothofagi CBS 11611]